jgi:hypothetical protein
MLGRNFFRFFPAIWCFAARKNVSRNQSSNHIEALIINKVFGFWLFLSENVKEIKKKFKKFVKQTQIFYAIIKHKRPTGAGCRLWWILRTVLGDLRRLRTNCPVRPVCKPHIRKKHCTHWPIQWAPGDGVVYFAIINKSWGSNSIAIYMK